MTDQETAEVVAHSLAGEKQCAECHQWKPRLHFQIWAQAVLARSHNVAITELKACQQCRLEMLDRAVAKARQIFDEAR